MKYNYLVIEGNIGAGKSTLAKMLAEQYNSRLILESFEENPFLPKFYKDRSKYAFPLEMSFLAERFQQTLDQLPSQDLFHSGTIADYHVTKSLFFARINLEDDEFSLYRTFFEIMYQKLPKPDLYVYLHRSADLLIQNIQKRGRDYELNIPESYLEEVHESYMNSLKSNQDFPILLLDIKDIDFQNDAKSYELIIDLIDQKYPMGISVKNLVE